MHIVRPTLVVLATLAVTGPAAAQTYSGAPLSPPALQQAVVEAVADRMLNADGVVVSDLRLSRARSGHGYCGFVAASPGAARQPFHVLVEQGSDPAVLILPEKGDPPGLPRADAVLLLTNLGCVS
ncbi:hypothetical protein OSH08_21035 [Kaistia geumhonensis]|uniref:Uncharacterized protein n=1 Tax=Kaistia geumhonensis TaxID=410839 RepID=A0ABU0MC69_9HYPH|nr:hypothetical protein [Kaistia geumhonensis]MCX5481497.1 hypothetical protein [Kaistia geumhonensis]MDQ0518562.1 hypothetical protein [Kaistia geumhonensis]